MKTAACLLLLAFAGIPASRLGDLAATVEPGEFLRVPFNDLTLELFSTQEGNYILDYTQNMVWAPAEEKLFFLGAHVTEPGKFIEYDARSDAWSGLALPAELSRAYLDRTYDHLAMDPVNSRLYYRITGANRFYRYQCPTGAWTPLPDNNLMTYIPCCGALEYFPDRDALFFLNGGETRTTGSLYFLPSDSLRWQLACDTLRLPDIGSFMVYNPVIQKLWMGGRSSFSTYLVGADGLIAPCEKGPHVFDPMVSNITVDPVIGEFLTLDYTAQMHTFNAQTGHWDSLNPPIPQIKNTYKMKRILSAPLPEYGVVAYLFGDTLGPEFYLYRHQPAIGVEKRTTLAPEMTLSISPNPVSDVMRVSFTATGLSGNQRVEIFDISGKLRRTFNLERNEGKCRLDGHGLSGGVYFVKVRSGTRICSRSFLFLE